MATAETNDSTRIFGIDCSFYLDARHDLNVVEVAKEKITVRTTKKGISLEKVVAAALNSPQRHYLMLLDKRDGASGFAESLRANLKDTCGFDLVDAADRSRRSSSLVLISTKDQFVQMWGASHSDSCGHECPPFPENAVLLCVPPTEFTPFGSVVESRRKGDTTDHRTGTDWNCRYSKITLSDWLEGLQCLKLFPRAERPVSEPVNSGFCFGPEGPGKENKMAGTKTISKMLETKIKQFIGMLNGGRAFEWLFGVTDGGFAVGVTETQCESNLMDLFRSKIVPPLPWLFIREVEKIPVEMLTGKLWSLGEVYEKDMHLMFKEFDDRGIPAMAVHERKNFYRIFAGQRPAGRSSEEWKEEEVVDKLERFVVRISVEIPDHWKTDSSESPTSGVAVQWQDGVFLQTEELAKLNWLGKDGLIHSYDSFGVWLRLQPPLRVNEFDDFMLVSQLEPKHESELPPPLRKRMKRLSDNPDVSSGRFFLMLSATSPCLAHITDSLLCRPQLAGVGLLFDESWLSSESNLLIMYAPLRVLADKGLAIKYVFLPTIKPIWSESSVGCIDQYMQQVAPVDVKFDAGSRSDLAYKLLCASSGDSSDDEHGGLGLSSKTWSEMIQMGAVLKSKRRLQLLEVVKDPSQQLVPITPAGRGVGMTTTLRFLSYQLMLSEPESEVQWLTEVPSDQHQHAAATKLSENAVGSRVVLFADADVGKSAVEWYRRCFSKNSGVTLVYGTAPAFKGARTEMLDPFLDPSDLTGMRKMFDLASGTPDQERRRDAVGAAVKFAKDSGRMVDRHFFIFALAAMRGKFVPAVEQMKELHARAKEESSGCEKNKDCLAEVERAAFLSALAPSLFLNVPKKLLTKGTLKCLGSWFALYHSNSSDSVCFRMNHYFARVFLVNLLAPIGGEPSEKSLMLDLKHCCPEVLGKLWKSSFGWLRKNFPLAAKDCFRKEICHTRRGDRLAPIFEPFVASEGKSFKELDELLLSGMLRRHKGHEVITLSRIERFRMELSPEYFAHGRKKMEALSDLAVELLHDAPLARSNRATNILWMLQQPGSGERAERSRTLASVREELTNLYETCTESGNKFTYAKRLHACCDLEESIRLEGHAFADVNNDDLEKEKAFWSKEIDRLKPTEEYHWVEHMYPGNKEEAHEAIEVWCPKKEE